MDVGWDCNTFFILIWNTLNEFILEKKWLFYKAYIQGAFQAEAFLVKSLPSILAVLAVIIKIENVFPTSWHWFTCHFRMKRTSPTAYCDCWEKCKCKALIAGQQQPRFELLNRLLTETDLVKLPNSRSVGCNHLLEDS